MTEEAESAITTLLRWAGDDPTREGLREATREVLAGLTAPLLNRSGITADYFATSSQQMQAVLQATPVSGSR